MNRTHVKFLSPPRLSQMKFMQEISPVYEGLGRPGISNPTALVLFPGCAVGGDGGGPALPPVSMVLGATTCNKRKQSQLWSQLYVPILTP